jgi:hypothetical protein
MTQQTYSDRPGAFSDPEDTFSRGQHFLLEAERLFRAEEGAPRLTTVQALLLMSCVYVNHRVLLQFDGL